MKRNQTFSWQADDSAAPMVGHWSAAGVPDGHKLRLELTNLHMKQKRNNKLAVRQVTVHQ
jgi:hypothetical protein